MYLEHFALREAPFSITPDTDFFYAHDGAQAALNMLLVALRSGEGFLKVVGELGCGKTVLCRHLLKTLQGEFVTAYIPNPDMGREELLWALAAELGISLDQTAQKHQTLQAINQCLLDHAAAGRKVLVCIDEAQAIPVATIESLRLLSNLETEKQKLVQIVLLGQPDLDEKLARPEIRQLLQRITFSEYLGPMEERRVPVYLSHRMARAARPALRSGRAEPTPEVFSRAAATAIARYSGGVPRLINILAHKCLMLAYGENDHTVTAKHAKVAALDTEGVKMPRPWWRWSGASMRRQAARSVR